MIVKVAEVEPVEMVPGIWRRTLSYSEGVMLVHFTLEEGSVLPEHSHPNDQVGYVLEGEITLNTPDQTLHLKAGESYALAANVKHSARVVKRTIVIDAFSPPREDYK